MYRTQQNKEAVIYASILRRGSTQIHPYAGAHPLKRKHSFHAADAVNYTSGPDFKG